MSSKSEQLKEQALRMSGVNPLKCMRCGKCSGTCPSYDEMEYHPHQFVYMVETGDIETLMNRIRFINVFHALHVLIVAREGSSRQSLLRR